MGIIEDGVEETASRQQRFEVDDELQESLAITHDLVVDWTFLGDRLENVQEFLHQILKKGN